MLLQQEQNESGKQKAQQHNMFIIVWYFVLYPTRTCSLTTGYLKLVFKFTNRVFNVCIISGSPNSQVPLHSLQLPRGCH